MATTTGIPYDPHGYQLLCAAKYSTAGGFPQLSIEVDTSILRMSSYEKLPIPGHNVV